MQEQQKPYSAFEEIGPGIELSRDGQCVYIAPCVLDREAEAEKFGFDAVPPIHIRMIAKILLNAHLTTTHKLDDGTIKVRRQVGPYGAF